MTTTRRGAWTAKKDAYLARVLVERAVPLGNSGARA